MPEYILNRTHTLRTTNGTLSFVKDEATFVPPYMLKDALAIGALPANGKKPDMLDPEVPPMIAPSGDERLDQLYAAFELIVERNASADFTGQGIPTVKAVEKIVDFDVVRDEVVKAYAAFKLAQAD